MAPIVIFLNGTARQLDATTRLESLITDLKLTPRMVLVEHNGRALLRHEWPDLTLQHGDRIEILRVVAGG
jgi:sulfur carrier protein